MSLTERDYMRRVRVEWIGGPGDGLVLHMPSDELPPGPTYRFAHFPDDEYVVCARPDGSLVLRHARPDLEETA